MVINWVRRIVHEWELDNLYIMIPSLMILILAIPLVICNIGYIIIEENKIKTKMKLSNILENGILLRGRQDNLNKLKNYLTIEGNYQNDQTEKEEKENIHKQ